MNILLIGATGTLGRTVLQRLKESKHQVTALSRRRNENEKNIRWVQGNIIDFNRHSFYLENQDVVISCIHGFDNRLGTTEIDKKAISHLIDCAKGSVKHFILVSILKSDTNVPVKSWRNKGKAEEHLRHSGLEYTIFKAPLFAESWWKYSASKTLKFSKLVHFSTLPVESTFISVQSLAELIIQSVGNFKATDRVFFVGNKKTYSEKSIAKLLNNFSGKKIDVIYLPFFLLDIAIFVTRIFHRGISEFLQMVRYLSEHGLISENIDVYDYLNVHCISPESVWQSGWRKTFEI